MADTYPITESALKWLQKILVERFGYSWQLSRVQDGLQLTLAGEEGSILFDTLYDGFIQAHSVHHCVLWDPSRECLDSALDRPLPAPGLEKLPFPLVEQRDSQQVIHYDILGFTYWMLSRLEEVGRTDLDKHERFCAVSSHAYKHGYLERPLVDEWLYILGQVIKRVWPRIILKQHEFNIRVSHDVDQPSLYAFKSWSLVSRMMVGHLMKRYDFQSFLKAPYIKLISQKQLVAVDPFNTFDWLMDVSEENNLQSAFYFICGKTNPKYDVDYNPEHPIIRKLLRRIHERGHEIGVHPSYGAFKSRELMKNEANRLKQICSEEGIKQMQWGGRMHYLRWKQPTTLRVLEEAGLSYDCTLGYPDRPGFRCGTCHEYPAFDPITQKKLSLRIRPLIVMECSVIDNAYLGFGVSEETRCKMLKLKENCNLVQGTFNLLWHNSYLSNSVLKDIYRSVVSP